MTRIVIKNGDVELPEAELVGQAHDIYVTHWANEPKRPDRTWLKSDWPDSYIVEPKRELPTHPPAAVLTTGGTGVPQIAVLDPFGVWFVGRTPWTRADLEEAGWKLMRVVDE